MTGAARPLENSSLGGVNRLTVGAATAVAAAKQVITQRLNDATERKA